MEGRGGDVAPGGHLTMSGDILMVTTGNLGAAIGVWLVEVMDAAKYPTSTGRSPYKSLIWPKCQQSNGTKALTPPALTPPHPFSPLCTTLSEPHIHATAPKAHLFQSPELSQELLS